VLTAEELLRLAPEFSCSSAKLYAIRPETLRDQEMEDGIAVTGTVDNVTMLGNITRYEISAVGVRLFADYLHHSWEPQDIGRKKTIYLDPKDVIPLDDASA
jgi:putative spermidine/putrescine transport system ATP-binding protein